MNEAHQTGDQLISIIEWRLHTKIASKLFLPVIADTRVTTKIQTITKRLHNSSESCSTSSEISADTEKKNLSVQMTLVNLKQIISQLELSKMS
ncbi:CLUMA_CG011484, isoform A [Clunio marinus]|uniref:CLUMA_CG011484, isoform A n=1 Tax=Clunio marinus TaxID=568069 RepID=A0A1J1IEY6_9DIPT|nr:CLUMA_CG011484, isoform A [Clunio marinus]